jgi:hypothetical protein
LTTISRSNRRECAASEFVMAERGNISVGL